MNPQVKTAEFVCVVEVEERPDVDQRLYRVNPPLTFEGIAGDYPDFTDYVETTNYIIVSAATLPTEFGGPETYMFPANEAGEIIDYSELEGSQRGTLDHTYVLNSAGYYIIGGPKALEVGDEDAS